MKTIHILSLCALGVMALAACSGDEYSHSASVVYAGYNDRALYADETTDTIVIQTTDSWTASTNVDWLTVNDDTKKSNWTYQYGYYTTENIFLTATPNTTGSKRTGTVLINVSGDDDFNTTTGAYISQLPVLEVDNYSAVYYNSDKTKFWYYKTAADSVLTDTLIFNVHNDWTLASSNETNILPQQKSGTKGSCKIPLTLSGNLSEIDTLKTTLTLTNTVCGISTPITFLQFPKTKK